jgi:putative phosphoribosyl transferase
MDPLFENRRDAGRQLAKKLATWIDNDNVIVLGLPRGGVPVAFEVAQYLHVPLDVILVRKLGVPGQEEVAIGAVALPDICVMNQDVLQSIAVPREAIDTIMAVEREQLKRRNRIYRDGRPQPVLGGRVVILVDDGIATGADMCAAVAAVIPQHPLRTIVAVPVAPCEALKKLAALADELICVAAPPVFFSVGGAYVDFDQTSDREVLALLKEAQQASS